MGATATKERLDEALFDDTSTMLTFAVELHVKNTRLSPSQRKSLHIMAVNAARELASRAALLLDEGIATIRVERRSSESGLIVIDHKE